MSRGGTDFLHEEAQSIMREPDQVQYGDPWSLLAKAENWCKLGLINEAIVIADEAANAEMEAHLGSGDPTYLKRKGTPQKLAEIIGVPRKCLLRLGELRKKAEQIIENGELTEFDAQEAISIAENIVTILGEGNKHQALEARRNEFVSHTRTLGSENIVGYPREGGRQLETEFVTRLLLVKAILDPKKKIIPRLIGSLMTIILGLACAYFGLMGGSGIILAFTGKSLLSISGVVANVLFLAVAYVLLKMIVFVRGATR